MELSDLSLEKALLFFFSAIGVLNTFFLALYFSLFIKNRNPSNRYLATLLLVIGLRETKSVLVLFLGYSVELLAFFGQSVDTMIGPMLFLYVSSYISGSAPKPQRLLAHTLPYLVAMIGMSLLISYSGQRYTDYSSGIGGIIYIQWITYIVLSANRVKLVIRKLFRREKLEKSEWWLITLIAAVFVIWLAYLLTHYGNYVLGGVSISVVLYLSLVLWLYGRRSAFYEASPKYGNKKILDEEAGRILSKLDALMKDREWCTNPNVKLADVASQLNVSPHLLSQLLNDNLQINFNHYINRFRIEAAKELIKTNHRITLEAIGVDSGFKSKSAFYTAFKSIQGQTPAQYRKAHLPN